MLTFFYIEKEYRMKHIQIKYIKNEFGSFVVWVGITEATYYPMVI